MNNGQNYGFQRRNLWSQDLCFVSYTMINKRKLKLCEQINIVKVLNNLCLLSENIQPDTNFKIKQLEHIKIDICYDKRKTITLYNFEIGETKSCENICEIQLHELIDLIDCYKSFIKTITIRNVYYVTPFLILEYYIYIHEQYQEILFKLKLKNIDNINIIYSIPDICKTLSYLFIDNLFQYLNNNEIFSVLQAVYPAIFCDKTLFKRFVQTHIRDITSEFKVLAINQGTRMDDYFYHVTNNGNFDINNCTYLELKMILLSIGENVQTIFLTTSHKQLIKCILKYCKQLDFVKFTSKISIENEEAVKSQMSCNKNIKIEFENWSREIETTLSSETLIQQLIQGRFDIKRIYLTHMNDIITEKHFENIFKLKNLQSIEMNASYSNIASWIFLRKLDFTSDNVSKLKNVNFYIDGLNHPKNQIEELFENLNYIIMNTYTSGFFINHILDMSQVEISNYCFKYFKPKHKFVMKFKVSLYNCSFTKSSEKNNILTHLGHVESITSSELNSTILKQISYFELMTFSRCRFLNNDNLLMIYNLSRIKVVIIFY